MLGPPFIGGLLRIVLQHVHDRMLQAVHDAGFTDFQKEYFAVFSYPLPDGVRPSDLAREKRMSRQALNHLLGRLTELGYVERRASSGNERRLIYLSPRGREVAETIFACLRQMHREWAQEVGQERFDGFLDVLRQLSAKALEADKGDGKS